MTVLQSLATSHDAKGATVNDTIAMAWLDPFKSWQGCIERQIYVASSAAGLCRKNERIACIWSNLSQEIYLVYAVRSVSTLRSVPASTDEKLFEQVAIVVNQGID